MTPLPKIVAAAILVAMLGTPAHADSVTICNDAGDLCVWRKTKPAGSFENPVVDNYPDEYRPGYLHAGKLRTDRLKVRGTEECSK